MKIEVMRASPPYDKDGTPVLDIYIGEGTSARTVTMLLGLSKDQLDHQWSEPVVVDIGIGFWMYRNRVVHVTDYAGQIEDELLLRIKHKVLSEEKTVEKLRREVEILERFEQSGGTSRTPIPDDVRLFVWQRDGGRCVKCGRTELLEYDHIIPLIKGGSNTERNVQLLCETCNRQKGSSIA